MQEKNSTDFSIIDTDKLSCRILAALLEAHGIKNVILSPGSRNAPIAMALECRKNICKYIITDERSASYAALGMAASSGSPVAVVCTSGTALLNYAPAAAEAYYQGLPLIIISADRPFQWIDQDDSQTLRQSSALGNIVKKSYNIPDFSSHQPEMKWFAEREINDALITATSGRNGPVHINMQLSAPLSSTGYYPLCEVKTINFFSSSDELSSDNLRHFAEEAKGKKILLIAGFLPPDSQLSKAVSKLASIPSVYILAETISNLHASGIGMNIDRILSEATPEVLSNLKPDLVISIGGSLISRMVKEWLRKISPAQHWVIGHTHTTVDPFMSLTSRIDVSPAKFISRLAGALKYAEIQSDYSALWGKINSESVSAITKAVKEAPWSDFAALGNIFPHIPKSYNLHCSNGTVIRYAQLFAPSPFHASFCNRGVSGIDGCTSSAVGSAIYYKNTTLLISGDMSFFYDAGILNSALIPQRFKIIVLNNNGGEIFRFVKSTANLPIREKYLCAPPTARVEDIAKAAGFKYLSAKSMKELKDNFKSLIAAEEKIILEIVTPPNINSEVLTNFLNRNQTHF